ncbi:hypothetical protein CA267_002885 [Alteromonas pelagimontana]|uniref:Uncharacterized protein n=1 Tax=Alteromonas pelagimontana TaxID=1858656 RepID=A0A6M4M9K8_9ALTE|nr:hypothetical protein [Alteromonas pelagimontana]QJR79807.1 hypothetical protein CA267_002885 [Alteromonas pelagimontana]
MDKKLAVARKNDRRNIPRSKDGFYRFVVGINFLGWGVLVAALIIFHFARPDFVTGLQAYWGMDGSEQWSQRYVDALILLLQACLTLSLVTMLLRA